MGGLIDSGLGDLFKGLIGLGGEFIEDKDKRNEYNMLIMQSQNTFNTVLISQKTHPYIDGAVKLLFALNSLWRPIGSACMTAVGIYAHIKGIPIDTANHALLDGAFPLWMGSRHMEKNKK